MTIASNINGAVDAMNTLLSTATNLGWATGITVYERDEHPARPAERNELPIVYNIPVMEGGMEIGEHIDDMPTITFPMTIVAYYLGTDVATDLRPTRNYAMNFADLLQQNQYVGVAWMTGYHIDVGYWQAVDRVIHYWICKINYKMIS